MVEILDETNRFRHAEQLGSALSALLARVEAAGRGITVVLLDDDAMRERNRAHRGIDESTDVLSYPTWEPEDVGMPAVAHLGDVFISLDTAERQARERGHDPLVEVLVLAAHGVTHLRGFDHPTAAAWGEFRSAEDLIVALHEGRA